MPMSPEEQAEFLAMKERAELAEHDRDNYKKEAEKFKDENVKLTKVNQEYFMRLTTVTPPEPPQPKKKESDDENVPTAASIVEELIKKRK